jgi:hypothetical protein
VRARKEPLAEGVVTGDPNGPAFTFAPGQASDVTADLKSPEH